MKRFIFLKNRLVCVLEKTTNFLFCANPGIKARLVLAGLVAFIFTAGVLQWSMNYGRLAYDMTYDDVGYFLDAYSRIQVFYQQGMGAMLSGLLTNPPHSPWSSLLAFIGFTVFGPFDWTPYLINGICVFLFLAFLVYILQKMHFVVSALLTVLFLFIPFSFFAVHEFRPDFIVGLSTCVFSFLAIESFSIGQNHDKLKLRCAGIVFGIALLSKPTFFAHTLALAIFVSVFIILFPMLTDHRKWWREKRKNLLFILRDFYLPGMVLAIPYYIFSWRHIWNYFWTNTRGTRSTIWNVQGNYWEVFKSFTVDGAIFVMIANYLYFFVGIVILSIVLLIKNRKWQELYILSGLLSVALVSCVIIVYGRVNNTFFGLTYQIMLCLAACYCLSAFYRNRAIFGLLIAAFILFSGWHVIESKPLLSIISATKSPLVRKENSVNLKIIRAIDCYLKKNEVASGKVFVSFAGNINASSMEWLAHQKSLPLEFSRLHTQDLVAFKEGVAKSDFVIVADEDADGIYQWYPTYAIQKPALFFLRSQPNMKEILIVETKKNRDTGCIRIFTNRTNLDKKIHAFDVSLPYDVQGFLPPEGPYPQWNLPTVRWGLCPASQILLPNKLAGKIQMDLSAQATPGTRLIIMVNATEIYSHVFSGHSFDDINTSFSAGQGANIVKFQYEGINHGQDQLNRAILFQNISLRPAGKELKKIEEKVLIVSADDLISQDRCQ